MRLVYVFILFALLTLSGCGLFTDPDRPTRQAVPAPEARDAGDGKVYYTPPESTGTVTLADAGASNHDADTGDAGGPQADSGGMVCELVDVVHETDANKVEDNIITFVEDTVTFKRTLDPQDEVNDADYVHLKSVQLVITSGADFDFVDWVRIYLDPENENQLEIAWGTDFPTDAYSIDLRVDGSLDLRQYLAEGVVMKGRVRASAPSKDTWIKARLTFMKFYNCE